MWRKLWLYASVSVPAVAIACTGADGNDGLHGPMGPAGDPASPGAPGKDGPAGEAGAAGPSGSASAGSTGTLPDGAPAPRSSLAAGPGLKLSIKTASIDPQGVATATFQITDGAGIPLDAKGIYTPGPVTISFMLAWLGQQDGDAGVQPLQYTSYMTRTQSVDGGSSAQQASTDPADKAEIKEVDPSSGTYEYKYATKIDVGPNGNRTHTVAAYATRTYQDLRYVANAEHHFVPAGGEVKVRREIVNNASCNKCHDPLAAHGGARRNVDNCIICHSPQTIDPDTGNTMDLKVLAHKIHMGKNLPSVNRPAESGGPIAYKVIGYGGSVIDFSHVGYPQSVGRCESCHAGGPQADAWKKNPSRAVCTSCHDMTSFVNPVPVPGMHVHNSGMTFNNDAACSLCHTEADIIRRHAPPAGPKVDLKIVRVANTGPNQFPEIEFSVTVDGQPRDILATSGGLSTIRATFAGPTIDYAEYWQYGIQTVSQSGAVSFPDGTVEAVPNSSNFLFKVGSNKRSMGAATGTYAVALEGYIQGTAAPGGEAPRFASPNYISYVPVTDTQPVPRRAITDVARCNDCHNDLNGHGGQRRGPDYCAMCHIPNNSNDERVSRFEGQSVTANTVDLRVMAHKIHRGEHLTQPYFLGGYPAPNAGNPAGTPIDFGEVLYPGDLRNCESCHTKGSYTLPLKSGLLPSRSEVFTCTEDPSADTNNHCSTRTSAEVVTPPATAVCTSCHDSPDSAAHAKLMTVIDPSDPRKNQESCTTCHGPGKASDPAGPGAHAGAFAPTLPLVATPQSR